MQQVGNALGVAVTGVIFFGALDGGFGHAFEVSLIQLARARGGGDRADVAAARAARRRQPDSSSSVSSPRVSPTSAGTLRTAIRVPAT